MTLPKVVRIGPIDYKVCELADLHTVDDAGVKHNMHGLIRWVETDIRINAEQSEQVKICTLWHEMIHGILNNAGINDHPEQVILALGFGLVQAMRDNPDVVAATLAYKSEVVNNG